MHDEIGKALTLLVSIIDDLLGPGADYEQVQLCIDSIMGQLLFQAHVHSHFARPPVRRESPKTDEMEPLARHIADFSLAGIERIRRSGEEDRKEK